MKNIAAIILAGVGVWFVAGKPDLGKLIPNITPPAPINPLAPYVDVQAAFSANADASSRVNDALVVSGLCDGLASAVEFDGTRSTPQLTYVSQIAALRTNAISTAFKGLTINTKYPAFGSAVKAAFETDLGDGSKPLDADKRAKAAAAFRKVAEGCRRVK
jgi:hypothetical protein